MRVRLYIVAVACALIAIWGDFNHFGRPYVVAVLQDTTKGAKEYSARIRVLPWPMPGSTRQYVIHRWIPDSGGYSTREDVLEYRDDGTVHSELTCLEESLGGPVIMGCLENVDAPTGNPNALKLYLREKARNEFNAYALLGEDRYVSPMIR